MKRKIVIAVIATLGAFGLAGCSGDDATVVSQNLSKAADNFEIERRIVFYNGITDKYMLAIQGKCSLVDQGNQLEVTCKVGDDEYKKHFLGLSDNVTYFSEQVEGENASPYYYRTTFKPQTLIPDIDVRGGAELPENQ
jgi:hypothetical protein